MPQGKVKADKLEALTKEFREHRVFTVEQFDKLRDRLGVALDSGAAFRARVQNQIAALEEAICPRVAARLLALERKVGLAPEPGPSSFPPGTKQPAEPASARDIFERILDNQLAQPETKRPPCTSSQIDAVARKINKVLGKQQWNEYDAEMRQKLRDKAHLIIHAVLGVMD